MYSSSFSRVLLAEVFILKRRSLCTLLQPKTFIAEIKKKKKKQIIIIIISCW